MQLPSVSRFVNLVNDAKTRVHEITVSELHEKMQRQEDFYLIDVREESEWNAGYLPRALHLSKGILERDIERFLPLLTTPIILYCNGGYRSCLAADNLQKMGYTNVSSLIGGFSAWLAAEFPLSS